MEDSHKVMKNANGKRRSMALLTRTLEFSKARTVAEYKLMGAAPAMRACQVFARKYFKHMMNIQMFESRYLINYLIKRAVILQPAFFVLFK
jgi:hypothetical protein